MFPRLWPKFFDRWEPYPPRVRAQDSRWSLREAPSAASRTARIDAVPCVRLPPAHVLMDGKESNQLCKVCMHVSMFN
jgi:hypothetical protein